MTVSSATRNMYPLVTIVIHTLHNLTIMICMYMEIVENGGYVDLQADKIIVKPGIQHHVLNYGTELYISSSDMFNELLKYQP